MTPSNTDPVSIKRGTALISNQKLLSLFARMIACRQAILALAASAQSGPLAGREAAITGMAVDLSPGDAVGPEVFSRVVRDAVNPKISSQVSSVEEVAAALNDAASSGKSRKIALLFSSGLSEASRLRQKSLKLAVEQKLPVVFVRFSGPRSARSSSRRQIEAATVPTITVDGADLVAIYRVASESIAYARNGRGPTLIDCLMAKDADPVANMATYLASKGLKPPKSRQP
jgi:hypothetical protein